MNCATQTGWRRRVRNAKLPAVHDGGVIRHSSAITVQPVGAQITGVDLARPRGPDALRVIRGALVDRGVVFFRDQPPTQEQHIALARQFGAINVNRVFAHAEGYPEIALLVKERRLMHRITLDGRPLAA